MPSWTTKGITPDPLYRKAKDPHSGQIETSAEMRAKLAAEGRPVLVAFSRGKDSICAMIALMEAGVEVIPVHLWRVPQLRFEEESLAEFEKFFGMKILNLPHRDFWYYLAQGVHMAPWQRSIVEAAKIAEIPHPVFWSMVKENLGLDPKTWVCDGIRAADSPMRRMSIQQRGPWTQGMKKHDGQAYENRMAHVVWDWKIRDIRQCIEDNKVKLPVDYELFNRTFDGLDYRFIKPLSEKLPEDYEQIRSWFPAVDLEMMRYEYI